jgi:CBS domain-containing protein
MKVSEIMTPDPVCAIRENSLVEVARMMKEYDCGAIPVVENQANRKPVGIVTDRDLAIRGLAEAKDPLVNTVESCMTPSLVSVRPEDDVEECVKLMEKHQLRRIVVVDHQGAVVGLVVQAHIARSLGKKEAGEMLQDISR